MKINVIVHPNSKKARIEKDLLNFTHIYVSEPALENRANLAVIKAISNLYNVPRSSVTLIFGAKSKVKVFEILSNL